VVAVAYLAACGGTPREAVAPAHTSPPTPAPHHLDDPDVNRHHEKLLNVDWSGTVTWEQIAPTGADVDAKLDEIPDVPAADDLAVAMINGGNFACTSPPVSCGAPLELPPPAPTATLADPCLRRILALWSLGRVDDQMLPRIRDGLRAIAALPPPESQLVAQAIRTIPDSDQDGRLELLAIAWKAGQRDVVNAGVADLDDAHILAALTKHHIDGALDQLTPDRARAAFLGAITDEQLAAATREDAMLELASADVVATGKDKLAPDLEKTLIAATKSPDCAVAAAAAHMFEARGDHRFGPKRPRARTVAPMMRAMCVLASYEQLQRPDEPSYLLGYVPAAGLELVRVTYDPYSDVDTDGDGDPHTTHTTELIKRDEVVLPELEDMIRALHHCKDSVCTSGEHEFRFGWKPGAGGELVLARLEVVDRPPCRSP
jgi:hypothetical protein